ncbi:HAD-IA family hydrolase [Paenibacillus sp. HJL G12]|uniref:HAD-IA family hydrolase n=1 Tax=Paenibacillus dendrobii TaxID=2691084 RepID=A0A7X3LHA2_9BACL|nr:HAD-IA family hydrolase [Paenibacillus dendrobii]MWV43343.1 HAD-IA family hydrolase [Paenibacillus dendrobii]
MIAKPQLVLDLAGVLVSNFSKTFWLEVSGGSDISFQDMKEQFNEIRKDLWTGKMKEEHFWAWIRERVQRMSKEEAQESLIHSLEPLPGFIHLERWSRIADIHILSNHCKEWLEHVLTELEPYTRSITISNQVGLCKPDIQIFKYVEQYFDKDVCNGTILYIDDQEKNLKQAKSLGWNTLLADQEHTWIEKVEPILLRNAVQWQI